eukprot:2793096-Rhodomonas_salina.1
MAWVTGRSSGAEHAGPREKKGHGGVGRGLRQRKAAPRCCNTSLLGHVSVGGVRGQATRW